VLVPVTHALLTSCSKDSFVTNKEKFDIIHLDVTLCTDRIAAGQQDAEESRGEVEEDTAGENIKK
jgi:hypothetical protein